MATPKIRTCQQLEDALREGGIVVRDARGDYARLKLGDLDGPTIYFAAWRRFFHPANAAGRIRKSTEGECTIYWIDREPVASATEGASC